jgi:hypothetical protein
LELTQVEAIVADIEKEAKAESKLECRAAAKKVRRDWNRNLLI